MSSDQISQRAQVDRVEADRAREAADRYEGTINALLCFRAIWCFDSSGNRLDTNCEFGRKMTARGGEESGSDTTVTPDLVMQESTGFAMAVEVKGSLPKDASKWQEDFDQLMKYRRIFAGWWHAIPEQEVGDRGDDGLSLKPGHSTIALLDVARSREFATELEVHLADRGIALDESRIAVVEFARADEKRQWIFFRVEGGSISHALGDELRRKGAKVPLAEVRAHTPSLRFCDYLPPLPYLIQIIWKDYVTPRGARMLRMSGESTIDVSISVEEVTSELQRAHGSQLLHKAEDSRSQAFPQPAWIKRALDTMVTVEYASRGDEPGQYLIKFRAISGDLLGHFATLLKRKKTFVDQVDFTGQYGMELTSPPS